MKEIVDLADRLGAAIAAHARRAALRTATDALRGDAEATVLEAEFAEAAGALREKMAAGRPVEPEEKRREDALRRKVASNARIQAYLRAQADFHELMLAVRDAIDRRIEA